ncbi:MAG: M28 family peptidase, partial [Terriglobia bacterium]
HFVSHFSEIDSVALMIQLDMADGASVLEIDPDGSRICAPSWLTKAAYEIFYSDLNYSGLVYRTHSEAINWTLGGGTGSDHAAFLEKGIPAIGFTSDVNYPVHTPQDNLENFTPSGLKRSGDLALKLVERFDREVPTRSTEKYMLVQFGITPVFFSYWLLWSGVALSLALAIATFVAARRKRETVSGTLAAKWSGLKLLLCTLIIQTCVWYSENIVGLMRGYRFPWINNFGGFCVLGILCGLIGLWVSLRLVQRMSLSGDPHVHARLAFIFLIAITLLSSIAGPKLAIYPAWALFFFSLAMRVQGPALKLLFFLASPYMIFRLAFPEWLGLIQRLFSLNTISSAGGSLRHNLAFVLGFTLLSLPFVCAFAAVYRS